MGGISTLVRTRMCIDTHFGEAVYLEFGYPHMARVWAFMSVYKLISTPNQTFYRDKCVKSIHFGGVLFPRGSDNDYHHHLSFEWADFSLASNMFCKFV